MSITVVSANAVRRYTTFAQIEAAMGQTLTSQQTFVEFLIDVASAAINDFCQRTFWRERVQEKLKGYGTPRLVVSRYPLETIHSIQFLDFDYTMPTSDYEIENANIGFIRSLTGVGFYYNAGTFPDTAGQWYGATLEPRRGSELDNIQVEYTAGYKVPTESGRDLPYPIEMACIEIVKAMLAQKGRDPNMVSENVPGAYSVTYAQGPVVIPPVAASLLLPYRRVRI